MFFIKKENNIKILFFLILFFPFNVFAAEVNFNEIMFDPKGSDTDREWVEIKNTASIPIDLEKYKICDSGSCHKLYDAGKGKKIPKESYGIIAKKPEKFLLDYPDFSGFLLKASFSLSNSKELIELKNESGQVVSVVEYNIELGGKNGDTFSLFGDTWKNGKATPGKDNIYLDKNQSENNFLNSSNNSNSSGSDDGGEKVKINRTYVEITDVIDGKKKLKAEIENNISTLIAGAESEFNARAYGITGIEIKGAEYFWSFGDGSNGYGKNTKHTYLFPGEYILTLIVKSSSFTGNTRKIIKVIKPKIEIVEVDDKKNWIKLKNHYNEILKLDGWFLEVDGDYFKIPKETYILPKKEIIFPNKITNLDVKKDSKIFLLFPNREKVFRFIDRKKDNFEDDKENKNEFVLKNNDKNGEEQKLEENKKDNEKTTKKEGLEKVEENESQKSKRKRKYKERKRKVYKNKKTQEKKNIDVDVNDYYFRNFVSDFQDNKKNESDFENKKFFSNTFSLKEYQKKKEFFIEKDRNFWSEHFYFISFLVFLAVILAISIILKVLEKKEFDKEIDELEGYEIIDGDK